MSSSDSDVDFMLWEDSDDENELMDSFNKNQEVVTVATASLPLSSKKRGGSLPGKKPNINRNFREREQRLITDYFAEDSTYDEKSFRRRYRMSKQLFERIVVDVQNKNEYFVKKPDAVGKMGLSAWQKCTAALRLLAYGICADAIDEYVGTAESTALKTLKEFCKTIYQLYGETYLRYPTAEDLEKLLAENEARGFPGMLGSLDCCHWVWRNCPTAWSGQYRGKEKKPTIILEAVASKNLFIWHAFFGMPGSNNDVNVLDRSPLFKQLYNGTAPTINYEINGRRYNQGYYLADGIYPHLSTLVQTISEPVGQKKKLFAKQQEAVRKDVERAFGVLQSRFSIIKQPARLWHVEDIKLIMQCCVILHNFIIEHDADSNTPEECDLDTSNTEEITAHRGNIDFSRFLQRFNDVHDSVKHYQLRDDLIEHIWRNQSTLDKKKTTEE